MKSYPSRLQSKPICRSKSTEKIFSALLAAGIAILLIYPIINTTLEPVKALEDAPTNKMDTSNNHAAPQVSESPVLLTNYLSNNEYSAQAALPGVFARQTNNIVNTNTYYDIIFNTATTAAIKAIRVTFPAGTDVSIARLVEAEGIGKGVVGPGSIVGQTVRYIVNGAEVTTIPAGTQIRLELANIVNPSSPGNGYKVTVETRDASNTIIDGPSESFAYPIKQIGNSDITNNAITTGKIADGSVGTNDIANNAVTAGKISPTFMQSKILLDGQNGWNPSGTATSWNIVDASVNTGNSHVYVSVDETSDEGPLLVNVVCMVEDIFNGSFQLVCIDPPANDSKLRYTVINQP
ncbi:MAG: hypothetical protein ACRD8Z_19635 [Nitrososphaeraceae archaeon]